MAARGMGAGGQMRSACHLLLLSCVVALSLPARGVAGWRNSPRPLCGPLHDWAPQMVWAAVGAQGVPCPCSSEASRLFRMLHFPSGLYLPPECLCRGFLLLSPLSRPAENPFPG